MGLDCFFSTGSTKARRYPLSYISGGFYDWNLGALDAHQGWYGYWWSTTSAGTNNAYILNISAGGPSSLVNNPQRSLEKTYAFALLCANVRIPILTKTF